MHYERVFCLALLYFPERARKQYLSSTPLSTGEREEETVFKLDIAVYRSRKEMADRGAPIAGSIAGLNSSNTTASAELSAPQAEPRPHMYSVGDMCIPRTDQIYHDLI